MTKIDWIAEEDGLLSRAAHIASAQLQFEEASSTSGYRGRRCTRSSDEDQVGVPSPLPEQKWSGRIEFRCQGIRRGLRDENEQGQGRALPAGPPEEMLRAGHRRQPGGNPPAPSP